MMTAIAAVGSLLGAGVVYYAFVDIWNGNRAFNNYVALSMAILLAVGFCVLFIQDVVKLLHL